MMFEFFKRSMDEVMVNPLNDKATIYLDDANRLLNEQGVKLTKDITQYQWSEVGACGDVIEEGLLIGRRVIEQAECDHVFNVYRDDLEIELDFKAMGGFICPLCGKDLR